MEKRQCPDDINKAELVVRLRLNRAEKERQAAEERAYSNFSAVEEIRREHRKVLDAIEKPSDFPCVTPEITHLDKVVATIKEGVSFAAELFAGEIYDLSRVYAKGTPVVPFEALMAIDQDYEERHPQPELRVE